MFLLSSLNATNNPLKETLELLHVVYLITESELNNILNYLNKEN